MKMLRFPSVRWSANLLLGSVFPWHAVALCVGGSFLLVSSSAFAQGNLTPPGTPAPTMKTLDQIASTGIAINATNTPGDANDDFIISAAGNYHLTANLGATKAVGLLINASGVTVDLNGFQIFRSSGSIGTGIFVVPSASHSTIKNGNLAGFDFGIQNPSPYAQGCVVRDVNISGCNSAGIKAGNAWVIDGCVVINGFGFGIITSNSCVLTNCNVNFIRNGAGISCDFGCTLSHCAVSGCTGTPISVDFGSTLDNCVASGNTLTGAAGAIYAIHGGCTLHNCSAYQNTGGSYGIYVGGNASLTNCSALNNTAAGAASYGIYVSASGSLLNCTSQSNTNSFGTPSAATGIGIYVGDSSSLTACASNLNKGDGIQATQSCTITNSTANGNGAGTGATGSGISAGTRTTISGCTANGNKNAGIKITGATNDGSTITNCTAGGNVNGITLNNSSTINNCTIHGNTGDGILANSANAITNNAVNANGNGSTTAGIHVTGFGNRIEGNELRDNNANTARGIKVDTASSHNVVIRNTAGNNGVNYDVSTGNGVGPLISADAGNVGNASNSPFANIQD